MRPRSTRRCTYPGCEREHVGIGYCGMHYYRLKHGIPMDAPRRGAVAKPRRTTKLCTIDGCGRKHAARGMCAAHYLMQRRGVPIQPVRPGYTGWTPEEDRILTWHIGMEPISAIAARLNRGECAVQRRANMLGLSFRREAEIQHGYTLAQVAALLGAFPTSVSLWVQHGWLRSELAWGARQQRYSVPEEYVIEFIRERGALMKAVRPTEPVLLAIHKEAREDLLRRYIQRQPLADMLGYNIQSISTLQTRCGMPVPALHFGSNGGGTWYDRSAIREWLDRHPERWTSQARREL